MPRQALGSVIYQCLTSIPKSAYREAFRQWIHGLELCIYSHGDYFEKKRKEKSPGSATITNHSPSHTPRGRGNRQIQTSTNQTNVQKALRLALSSPSEVIAILKGLEKHKNKMTHGKTYNKSPRRINHKATKSKTNTGITALERS